MPEENDKNQLSTTAIVAVGIAAIGCLALAPILLPFALIGLVAIAFLTGGFSKLSESIHGVYQFVGDRLGSKVPNAGELGAQLTGQGERQIPLTSDTAKNIGGAALAVGGPIGAAQAARRIRGIRQEGQLIEEARGIINRLKPENIKPGDPVNVSEEEIKTLKNARNVLERRANNPKSWYNPLRWLGVGRSDQELHTEIEDEIRRATPDNDAALKEARESARTGTAAEPAASKPAAQGSRWNPLNWFRRSEGEAVAQVEGDTGKASAETKRASAYNQRANELDVQVKQQAAAAEAEALAAEEAAKSKATKNTSTKSPTNRLPQVSPPTAESAARAAPKPSSTAPIASAAPEVATQVLTEPSTTAPRFTQQQLTAPANVPSGGGAVAVPQTNKGFLASTWGNMGKFFRVISSAAVPVMGAAQAYSISNDGNEWDASKTTVVGANAVESTAGGVALTANLVSNAVQPGTYVAESALTTGSLLRQVAPPLVVATSAANIAYHTKQGNDEQAGIATAQLGIGSTALLFPPAAVAVIATIPMQIIAAETDGINKSNLARSEAFVAPGTNEFGLVTANLQKIEYHYANIRQHKQLGLVPTTLQNLGVGLSDYSPQALEQSMNQGIQVLEEQKKAALKPFEDLIKVRLTQLNNHTKNKQYTTLTRLNDQILNRLEGNLNTARQLLEDMQTLKGIQQHQASTGAFFSDLDEKRLIKKHSNKLVELISKTAHLQNAKVELDVYKKNYDQYQNFYNTVDEKYTVGNKAMSLNQYIAYWNKEFDKVNIQPKEIELKDSSTQNEALLKQALAVNNAYKTYTIIKEVAEINPKDSILQSQLAQATFNARYQYNTYLLEQSKINKADSLTKNQDTSNIEPETNQQVSYQPGQHKSKLAGFEDSERLAQTFNKLTDLVEKELSHNQGTSSLTKITGGQHVDSHSAPAPSSVATMLPSTLTQTI